MILKELQKIKSFGGSMESIVTQEDIAKKEAELGFCLPQALRELYMTFHPDDPVFMGSMHLIPVQELAVCKRTCWTDTIVTILPFCRDEKYGYGFEVSRYHKKLASLELNNTDDPQVCGLYVFPETGQEKKYLNDYEVPCNKSELSRWLVEWLGYEQTCNQPSVVMVNTDKETNYWKSVREVFADEFYHIPLEQLSIRKRNFAVMYTEEPAQLLCSKIQYSNRAYFGAKTDKDLEKLMKQMGFKYVWIKSQTGHPVYNSAPPEPPQARELLSIAPVLQFLREFAGIEKTGAKEESIERAKARLGNPLPLPMEEFYRYLPSTFYHSYNTVRPLSGLKQAKDGKLNFLEENQAVYYWAAELDGPFVYRRINDGSGNWAAYGILDGFLAAEFLWALACDEDLDLNLWEFPDFEPEMLSEGGMLAPHLSPIAGITEEIAVGNTRKLYQAMDGQAVGLYDGEERTFWFITKEEAAQEQLETMLGFPHDDCGKCDKQ